MAHDGGTQDMEQDLEYFLIGEDDKVFPRMFAVKRDGSYVRVGITNPDSIGSTTDTPELIWFSVDKSLASILDELIRDDIEFYTAVPKEYLGRKAAILVRIDPENIVASIDHLNPVFNTTTEAGSKYVVKEAIKYLTREHMLISELDLPPVVNPHPIPLAADNPEPSMER